MLDKMQMPKDNTLSTVLLLVALGFLIYYLTKPKTVDECFAQEEKPASKQVVSETPKSETPKSVTPKSEVMRQIVEETRRPQAETPRVEVRGNQMDVFQFEPSDVNESGALLDAAFQRPIPQEARPDVVDINKNNVKIFFITYKKFITSYSVCATFFWVYSNFLDKSQRYSVKNIVISNANF